MSSSTESFLKVFLLFYNCRQVQGVSWRQEARSNIGSEPQRKVEADVGRGWRRVMGGGGADLLRGYRDTLWDPTSLQNLPTPWTGKSLCSEQLYEYNILLFSRRKGINFKASGRVTFYFKKKFKSYHFKMHPFLNVWRHWNFTADVVHFTFMSKTTNTGCEKIKKTCLAIARPLIQNHTISRRSVCLTCLIVTLWPFFLQCFWATCEQNLLKTCCKGCK